MKILQTSDWHLDWKTHGVSRFDELWKAVEASVTTAIEQEVDLYAFTGDLCDPDAGGTAVFECAEVALWAASRLQNADIPSVWCSGNHDVIEDGRGRTTLAPLAGYAANTDGMVKVYEAGMTDVVRLTHSQAWGSPFCEIIALPYPSATRPYDMDKVFAPHDAWHGFKGSEPRIILSHLAVPGVVQGEEIGEMARGRDVMYPIEKVLRGIKDDDIGAAVMLQGHYHRQQSLNFGGVYMHIPGSLAQLTFSEEHYTSGYLIIEVG